MDYDGLRDTYWREQGQRVQKLRSRIVARAVSVPGRTVPGDEDLIIGDGRRLHLAIMFLDISGFSGRPSGSFEDQEMLLRILNLFFSEMIKIAEDYGGTVEKNTGDGFMAYFENDTSATASKRALASALTMIAANDYLVKPILDATPTEEIRFRISIDYGPVTVARLGAAQRFNANVAIGATANFASKMLALAEPGEIVIGELAKEQLPSTWQLSYTELITTETGWIYTADDRPYSLYRYTGRWSRLI